MTQFIARQFNIPKLKGISDKTVEEHLKLYAGYVKNTNLILQKIEELAKDSEKYAYELGEIQRRFGFEYDGMRNHEIYFDALSNGAKIISKDGELHKAIESTSGSFEAWLARFKAIAMSRGIGWAMLYYDKKDKCLLNAYVGDHELGQLSGCAVVLALDMWEHAYIYDYPTSEKKKYVEAFFENLNWDVAERNFKEAL